MKYKFQPYFIMVFLYLNFARSQFDITNCTELKNMQTGIPVTYTILNEFDCINTTFTPIGNSTSKFIASIVKESF